MLGSSLIAGGVLALCAGTRQQLEHREAHREKPGRAVAFHPYYNTGAAFGQRHLRGRSLIGLSCGALGTAAVLTAGSRTRRGKLGGGLILGGGLSNLCERLYHGKVFDYIRFPRMRGKAGKLCYNLADFSIFAGVLLLLTDGKRK